MIPPLVTDFGYIGMGKASELALEGADQPLPQTDSYIKKIIKHVLQDYMSKDCTPPHYLSKHT